MHENCTKLLQERPGHTISNFQTFLCRVSQTLDAIDRAIMVPQVSDVLSAVEDLKESLDSSIDVLTG